jgi:hypothetical protein
MKQIRTLLSQLFPHQEAVILNNFQALKKYPFRMFIQTRNWKTAMPIKLPSLSFNPTLQILFSNNINLISKIYFSIGQKIKTSLEFRNKNSILLKINLIYKGNQQIQNSLINLLKTKNKQYNIIIRIESSRFTKKILCGKWKENWK